MVRAAIAQGPSAVGLSGGRCPCSAEWVRVGFCLSTDLALSRMSRYLLIEICAALCHSNPRNDQRETTLETTGTARREGLSSDRIWTIQRVDVFVLSAGQAISLSCRRIGRSDEIARFAYGPAHCGTTSACIRCGLARAQLPQRPGGRFLPSVGGCCQPGYGKKQDLKTPIFDPAFCPHASLPTRLSESRDPEPVDVPAALLRV